MSEELSRHELTVLHALRFLLDDEDEVTVSQKDIAVALGWSVTDTVRRAMNALDRRGLVRVTRNSTPKFRRANTFAVTDLGHLVAEMNLEAAA